MGDNPRMNRLIEQSWLGTEQAKQMRSSVPVATGRAIVRAAAKSGQWSKTSDLRPAKKSK